MDRFTIISAVLALALHCAPCTAQEARSIPASPEPQPIVRRNLPPPAPFSLGESRPVAPVEFYAAEKMAPKDRDLQTGSLGAISRRANDAGLNFDQGTWEAQQIVCAALPDHLFLAFMRDGGTDHVSAFTASIPRGAGQLRVMPILRRGYSTYSTAPVSAQTISAFNHIRAEEHSAPSSDWLATGLCYAALAGAHPRIGLTGEAKQPNDSAAASASMTISAGSGGEMSFLDLDANSRLNQWTLSFDASGKLLSVALSRSQVARERVKQRTPIEIQGKVVPQTAEVQGKQVPQQADPKGKPVAANESIPKTIPNQ